MDHPGSLFLAFSSFSVVSLALAIAYPYLFHPFIPSVLIDLHCRQDTHPTWGQPSQAMWSGGQPHTNTSLQSQYQQPYRDPNQQYQESYYDPNPPGESRILGSGYTTQSPPRPSGVSSSPTFVPNATYVASNPATKPMPNSTYIASNSSTPTGPSTYSLPTTGISTSPPEFAQRSGDAQRLPSTGSGMPSGIDPS